MCYRLIPIAIIGAAMLFIFGCSGGGNQSPVVPSEEPAQTAATAECQSSRILWGMWNIHLDPSELTATIEPLRNPEIHFNVTSYVTPPACNDCIEIDVNSFDPVTRILDADVTLRNPTQFIAHDVRGILYTNEAGHRLMNADDWTGLWDIPGGMALNPFRAFAKYDQFRSIKGGKKAGEGFQIYIPQPPQYASITFAVDASWPHNCFEPYMIDNFHLEGISETVGSIGITHIDVFDHQDDITAVAINIPEITGEESTPFTKQDENTWVTEVVNNTGAPAGDYSGLIKADSPNGGNVSLYDFVTITVQTGGTPTDAFEVTPPGFNFSPRDIIIDGDLAYIGGSNGLHVFDITDPATPMWLAKGDLPSVDISRMAISNGYAFIVDYWNALYIVDIDPIESAEIINTIQVSGYSTSIAVSGGYAYVGNQSNSITVYDIDPIESAEFVHYIFSSGDTCDIVISGNYAYAACWGGLRIIDIRSPESAEVVWTVAGFGAWGVAISGDYAYVAGYDDLTIIDISYPESAHSVGSLKLPEDGYEIAVWGGYAYIPSREYGLQIVDIDPPESPSLVGTVDTPGEAGQVAADDGYAYVIDNYSGLQVIDVEPADSAFLAESINCPGLAKHLEISGTNIFLTDGYSGLQVIDITQPEFPEVIKIVNIPFEPGPLAIDGDYAYVADGDPAVNIIDISTIDSAHIIGKVELPGSINGLDVSGGYLYAATGYDGLQIIDVDPPGSASIVHSIEPDSYAYAVVVSGGYAYMTDPSLEVIDITSPESAFVAYTIAVGAFGLAINDGYAYSVWSDSFLIGDIDPPESGYVVSIVEVPEEGFGIDVTGGYAYVADGHGGLQILDVDPPESAFILSYVNMTAYAEDVEIVSNYAYVAGAFGGLKILKLW